MKITLILAMGAGVLLSYPLWHSNRLFPLVPVGDFLPAIPSWLAFSLPIFLLLLFGVILVLRRPKHALLAGVGFFALLVLFDYNRLQPWVYSYGFMAAALSCFYRSVSEPRKAASALHACRFLLCATYLWAGTQKLNSAFITRTFALTFGSILPDTLPSAVVRTMAVCAALLEILIGVFLFFPRTRKPAIVLAVGLHGALLILLGPLRELNSVVWPWNVAMIFFVVVLFKDTGNVGALEVLVPHTPLHVTAIFLFGLMPALSFVGAWDAYLSFKLYSGNTHRAFIAIPPNSDWRWPARYHPFLKNSRALSVEEWALKELNVPPYPQERVYRKVIRQVWLDAGRPPELQLLIESEPEILTGKRTLVHLTAFGEPAKCGGCRHDSPGEGKD